MYKLSYDEKKNRIFIYVEGVLTSADFDGYIGEMLSLIDKTKPGFTVLADSSKCDISFLNNSAKLQVIRDYGISKGFKSVGTVLGDAAYEMHQINPFPGIKNTFKSIIDAEAYLDGLSRGITG